MPPLERIAHLALGFGRILFQNNASTEEVEDAVRRVAAAFGCEVHLAITYETLLLTVESKREFRTRAGRRVPSMNVNMATVAAVKDLVGQIEAGADDVQLLQRRLDEIDSERPLYGRWIVILGLSLTAASLSRLFGGDWPTFGVTFAASVVGTWLRTELGRRGANLFLVAFLTALASGIVAGIAVRMGFSSLAALCLVAPGMIIVPGVPLVNSVQDMIQNHMPIGIARLGLGIWITLAIAFGLVGATVVTGVPIPVIEPARLPSLPEDALFSGLAALGYTFLFNVPLRLVWVGVLCGIASHTTRTFCLMQGLDIVSGSLIGALAVGFLAHRFARAFRAPASAFAFPGVVAMIPGAFAFRLVVGYLELSAMGTAAPITLVAETLSLSATTVLMVLMIAAGVAAPLILSPRNRHT